MPLPDHSNNNIGNNNNNVTMPFSALMTNHHLDHNPTLNPIRSSRLPEASDGQSPFTLEMLQNHGGFGFSGYMNSIMNQPQSNDVFSKGAKEEPRDDMFPESLLCWRNFTEISWNCGQFFYLGNWVRESCSRRFIQFNLLLFCLFVVYYFSQEAIYIQGPVYYKIITQYSCISFLWGK